MTVKVLIVDPDISFTVPIKRALEMSGDYKVSVFTGGRTALELLQRESHDVAILDFNVGDIPMRDLIDMMHRMQPWLFILVSPRTPSEIAQLPTLNIQGSITKPYFARQLGPVIREAALTKSRHSRRTSELARVPDLPETSILIDRAAQRDRQSEPIASGEPPVQPDDTFRRVMDTVRDGNTSQIRLEGASAPVIPADEPPIPADATVRDLVSGRTASASAPPTAPAPLPESGPPQSLPEAPPSPQEMRESSPAAEIALEVAVDTSVPLENLAQALAEKVEMVPPEDRPNFAQADEEPSFVAAMFEQMLNEPPRKASDTPVVPMPAIEIGDESPGESVEDPTAALALKLMQLTVESAAQATLLSKGNQLLAQAGSLPEWAVEDVLVEIGRAWQGAQPLPEMPSLGDAGDTQAGANPRPALFRYIQLGGDTDFLMYSTSTLDGMTLSMLFPGDVPLRVIRRQARQLREALERVPDAETLAEPESGPEAARTLLSRPTDLHPPPGLRDVVTTAPVAAPAAEDDAKAETAPQIEAAPEVAYASYAFLWLPRQGSLTPEQIGMLSSWLHSAAEAHGWRIDGLEAQAGHVAVQVSIPNTLTASACVETLMRETASRAENSALWAESFYIVTPGRAITQQEIANFAEYQREAEQ